MASWRNFAAFKKIMMIETNGLPFIIAHPAIEQVASGAPDWAMPAVLSASIALSFGSQDADAAGAWVAPRGGRRGLPSRIGCSSRAVHRSRDRLSAHPTWPESAFLVVSLGLRGGDRGSRWPP